MLTYKYKYFKNSFKKSASTLWEILHLIFWQMQLVWRSVHSKRSWWKDLWKMLKLTTIPRRTRLKRIQARGTKLKRARGVRLPSPSAPSCSLSSLDPCRSSSWRRWDNLWRHSDSPGQVLFHFFFPLMSLPSLSLSAGEAGEPLPPSLPHPSPCHHWALLLRLCHVGTTLLSSSKCNSTSSQSRSSPFDVLNS